MRLISWNVCQGGGRRRSAQVAALAVERPDLVALQEVTIGGLTEFSAALSSLGLIHQTDSFRLSPNPELLLGPRRYGQLIASRWLLVPLPPSDYSVPWPERVLSAKVAIPGEPIELHTTHIPPGASHGWLKIDMFEGIFARLERPSTTPRILCGDLNTPQEESPSGEVITWGQEATAGGGFALWPKWERWDRGERQVLTGLAASDLTDVFRRLNGYGPREHSWFWRGRGREIGRRFDHIFAADCLNAVECRYLHEWRSSGLSDHAAISADFAPLRLTAPPLGPIVWAFRESKGRKQP